jgi:cytochrome c6
MSFDKDFKPIFNKLNQLSQSPLDRRTKMFKMLLGVLLSLTLLLGGLAQPAWAGDAANGAKIFSGKCASCHLGGNNVVNPQKTLKKDVLESFGMLSEAAIVTQVTNGKAAMPKFLGQLTESEIEDVADYVLAQAEKGWQS